MDMPVIDFSLRNDEFGSFLPLYPEHLKQTQTLDTQPLEDLSVELLSKFGTIVAIGTYENALAFSIPMHDDPGFASLSKRRQSSSGLTFYNVKDATQCVALLSMGFAYRNMMDMNGERGVGIFAAQDDFLLDIPLIPDHNQYDNLIRKPGDMEQHLGRTAQFNVGKQGLESITLDSGGSLNLQGHVLESANITTPEEMMILAHRGYEYAGLALAARLCS